MKTGTPIWSPTDNEIAQCSHFFIASTLVFGAGLLGLAWWWSIVIVLGWSLPKEFIFDLTVEKDSLSDSIQDFSWYCIGGVVAMAVRGLLL